MLPSLQRHATLGGRKDSSWDRSFTVRKSPDKHGPPFDQRLFHDTEDREAQDIVERFLESGDALDPKGPSHVFLRAFLSGADYGVLKIPNITPGPPLKNLAIYDDRKEPNTFQDAVRNWDNPIYRRGPSGVNIAVDMVNQNVLLTHLSKKREHTGAERRILFIRDPTKQYLLVLIDTIPWSFASNFRDFLERHLTRRALFQLSKVDFGWFVLEFHIPYLALRPKGSPIDDREVPGGYLRQSNDLPVRVIGETPDAVYHEAQISFLLFGPDEWFWTVYCFVDTYFGSEDTNEEYLRAISGAPANLPVPQDAPTGGKEYLDEPIWNPREYFLRVLSRRMEQVSKEWSNLVAAMNERLSVYIARYNRDIEEGRFFDDLDYSGTIGSTRAVSVLRHFREVLGDTLYAWDMFAGIEPECFVCEYLSVNETWSSYISDINDSVAHLRFLERSLAQKIQLFDRMKDDLLSASALKENRAATNQGDKISILTYATVIYLPFTFAAGLFSMSMIPSDFSWRWYLAASFTLSAVTFPVAFRYQELQALFTHFTARWIT